MRRLILILLGLPLLLILAVVLLAPLIVDKQKLLALATESVQQETGAILTVEGDIGLSVFPKLSVTLQKVGLTMPGEQPVVVALQSLDIGLQLLPLLSGAMQIDGIQLDGLSMVLHASPAQEIVDTSEFDDRQLDAYYADRRELRRSAMASRAGAEQAMLAVPMALNIQRLTISNSIVEIESSDSGERNIIKIVNLEAKNLNLDNSPISVKTHLQLPEEENPVVKEIKLKGSLSVDGASRQISLASVLVQIDGVMASAIEVEASGVVDLLTQATDLEIEFSLGETQGAGTLHYAIFESPQIDANLHLNSFDPALVVLAGPGAVEAKEEKVSTSADTDEGDRPLPLGAIREIDTRLALRIDRAVFSGHAVEDLTAKMRAVDGIVRLNSLVGSLHGGVLDMQGMFDAQHSKPKLNMRGTLVEVDVSQVLATMELDDLQISGKADMNWRLNSQGNTSNAIIDALSGPIDLNTADITLENIGIEKRLCEAVAQVNRKPVQNKIPDVTTFKNLSVKMIMANGSLEIKPLIARLPHIGLNGTGKLSLLEQTFTSIFVAKLSAGLVELDPACAINERYSEIGWPVTCKGNLAEDPAQWCSVDTQKIIEQMATKEVERKIEKEAGKLLNKFLKK